MNVYRVNFRSTPAIVAAGNEIANAPYTNGNNMGGVFNTVNSKRPINNHDGHPPQLKEMIANSSQHRCISEPGSFARMNASTIGRPPKCLDILPLGAVVITACLKTENAEFEYVSAILNSLVLPKPALMPSSSSSSSDYSSPNAVASPQAGLLRLFDHEMMIEKVAASDIAILFRKNSVGKQLQKYLKYAHPGLNFVWKSRKDTGS